MLAPRARLHPAKIRWRTAPAAKATSRDREAPRRSTGQWDRNKGKGKASETQLETQPFGKEVVGVQVYLFEGHIVPNKIGEHDGTEPYAPGDIAKNHHTVCHKSQDVQLKHDGPDHIEPHFGIYPAFDVLRILQASQEQVRRQSPARRLKRQYRQQ